MLRLPCFTSVPFGHAGGACTFAVASLAADTLRALKQSTGARYSDEWSARAVGCLRGAISGSGGSGGSGHEFMRQNNLSGMVQVLVGTEGRSTIPGLAPLRGTDLELAVLAEAAAAAWVLGGGRSAAGPGTCYADRSAPGGAEQDPGAGDRGRQGAPANDRDLLEGMYDECREGVMLSWEPGVSHVVVLQKPEDSDGSGAGGAGQGGPQFGSRVNRAGRCELPFGGSWESDGVWASGPFASAGARHAASTAVGQVSCVPVADSLPFLRSKGDFELGYASCPPPLLAEAGASASVGHVLVLPASSIRPVTPVAPFTDAGHSMSSGGSFFESFRLLAKVHSDALSNQRALDAAARVGRDAEDEAEGSRAREAAVLQEKSAQAVRAALRRRVFQAMVHLMRSPSQLQLVADVQHNFLRTLTQVALEPMKFNNF